MTHQRCFCFVLLAYVVLSAFPRIILAEDQDSLQQLSSTTGSHGGGLIPETIFHLIDHGAVGNGTCDDTEAFLRVWKLACATSAPTRIIVPAKKTFLVRPVNLSGPCRSKVTLQISGRVVAPEDPDVWNGLNPNKWLYFSGIKHLYLEGRGRVNGMGRKWWSRSCRTNSTYPCRPAPTALTFEKCKNLRIQNLMVLDSQKKHMTFTNCLRVKVSNLRVIAPPGSPKTDGIHITGTRSVKIADTIIRTGGDCISIGSNSSQIKIRNIICGPGEGISIGSLGEGNSWSDVNDVLVERAFLSNTLNGLRIKTWQGGRGSATNIIFRNVWMENVSNPIIIDQYYCDAPKPCLNQTQAVRVENVQYMQIKGTSVTEEAMIFHCSDKHPCTGLYLEDIQLVSALGGDLKSVCYRAYGTNNGNVIPHPCYKDDSFIEQKKIESGNSTVVSI